MPGFSRARGPVARTRRRRLVTRCPRAPTPRPDAPCKVRCIRIAPIVAASHPKHPASRHDYVRQPRGVAEHLCPLLFRQSTTLRTIACEPPGQMSHLPARREGVLGLSLPASWPCAALFSCLSCRATFPGKKKKMAHRGRPALWIRIRKSHPLCPPLRAPYPPSLTRDSA